MAIEVVPAEPKEGDGILFTSQQRHLVRAAEVLPVALFVAIAIWMSSKPGRNLLVAPPNTNLLVAFVLGLTLAHLSAVILFEAGWRQKKSRFAHALFACAAILEIEVFIVVVAGLILFLAK